MRNWQSFIGVGALCVMLGCSGGGGSTTPPAPQASLPGAGAAAVFNQKVTFTINVPATDASTSAKRRRAGGTTSTTPYVSPNTASILLSLAEVNNVSPQQAPPVIAPINVPASCQGSTSGCTIPVNNVPAATGVNRYFVQTYAGPNATGSLISTGFVDVTVPSKNTTAIGGSAAALSIGGYVAAISISPPLVNFVQGTPSTQNVLVQALDAGGATIVGAAQYATPITVMLGSDLTNFTIGGSTTVTVTGPLAAALVLAYNGAASAGAIVTATSIDGSGNTVTAGQILRAIVNPPGTNVGAPPPVIPTPTPSPSPSPTPKSSPTPPNFGEVTPTPVPTTPPKSIPTGLASMTPRPTPTAVRQSLSLYVADGQSDTVSEYRIASQIEAGTIPNPSATPSRVVGFTLPAALSNSVSCAPNPASPSGNGNGTAGVTLGIDGTLYLFPNCFDGNNDDNPIFGYAPQAVGTPAPTIVDPVPLNFNGTGQPLTLAYDSTRNLIVAADNGSDIFVSGTPAGKNGAKPTFLIGQNGYPELGFSGDPYNGSGSTGFFNTSASGIAIDSNENVYVPAAWYDQPLTGDAASLQQPSAMIVTPGVGTGTTSTYADLAGINSILGGSTVPPIASTVDGSTLYILAGTNTAVPEFNGGQPFFPGLSACPSPIANPPLNTTVPTSAMTQCQDGSQHTYLIAYNVSALSGPQAYQTNVDPSPYFVIGGDVVGGFGCQDGTVGGQFLAASAGYVYVINLTPTCPGNSPTLNPEIDVYNTNGVTGVHEDIKPVLRLPLPNGFPLAVTIGKSATSTGGQALLRSRRQAYNWAQHRAAEARYPKRHAPPRAY